MVKIAGEHGCGKTTELIKKASDVGGVIFCKNEDYVINKARNLGITNIDALPYNKFNSYCGDRKIFVDNVDGLFRTLNVEGYTCEV